MDPLPMHARVCSAGAWGDADYRRDVAQGLPPIRSNWILERGDVEGYAGREVKPQDDGFLYRMSIRPVRVLSKDSVS